MHEKRKGFKKSSKETVRLMRVLYKQGMNVSEIGLYLNIHRTTVLYWLKKIDGKSPKRGNCGK